MVRTQIVQQREMHAHVQSTTTDILVYTEKIESIQTEWLHMTGCARRDMKGAHEGILGDREVGGGMVASLFQ